MKKNHENYYYRKMPDQNFFVDIFEKNHSNPGTVLNNHWHEHIQFFYFLKGKALIRCNSKNIIAEKNDFVIINSNELHCMENLGSDLNYYVIRVDLSFLSSSQIDSCQTKFIVPLSQNLILFKNLVRNNDNVTECAESIIKEYLSKKIGFELVIKSYVYKLIALLLRGYIDKIFTPEQFNNRINKLNNFNIILKYIEDNFDKKITIDKLSSIANVTNFHFCRLFKQITGETAVEYINNLRINKAMELLQKSGLTITEIALSCGFNDSNYFSRVFKKNKGISPSSLRKADL